MSESHLQPDDPQGMAVSGGDPEALRAALELAFDYRGDVTIVRRSTDAPVEGFVFDRVADGVDSVIRLMDRVDGRRITIPYADIDRLHFSGRNTAAGKSFETWMKKYVQKKLAGERASIESETLE